MRLLHSRKGGGQWEDRKGWFMKIILSKGHDGKWRLIKDSIMFVLSESEIEGLQMAIHTLQEGRGDTAIIKTPPLTEFRCNIEYLKEGNEKGGIKY